MRQKFFKYPYFLKLKNVRRNITFLKLMRKNLTPRQMALADQMSSISERCYYAGWMQNLEYILWDTLKSGERKYGHDWITQQDIDTLKDLAWLANCWIVYDKTFEETTIKLSDWQERFQDAIKKNPKLLNG
jgi:hypothetical protein